MPSPNSPSSDAIRGGGVGPRSELSVESPRSGPGRTRRSVVEEGSITEVALLEVVVHHLLERQRLVPALEAALSSYDSPTAQHSQRVAVLAATMGEAWGLSERERLVLGWSGALHDVGKVAVSAAVLSKQDQLTASEWAAVKEHPSVGANLLLAIHEDLDPVAVAVRSHHERWDGAGYPAGLAGVAIPLLGRILAVVDAFDAMTAGRPYHRAKSPHDALLELSDQAGTQFDPELVGLFTQLHREHRLG